LPLHHATFGVGLAEAGLLLAANRLVRIAGYGWVARLYAERGPRLACLLAAAGSLLSTLGYATLSGVWGLLIARLLWGLSFAAMNIATQALATAEVRATAAAVFRTQSGSHQTPRWRKTDSNPRSRVMDKVLAFRLADT
jgi:MFS family permease